MCSVNELVVFSPNVQAPFSKDEALNSWDQAPSESSRPQPLILAASDPKQANDEKNSEFDLSVHFLFNSFKLNVFALISSPKLARSENT